MKLFLRAVSMLFLFNWIFVQAFANCSRTDAKVYYKKLRERRQDILAREFAWQQNMANFKTLAAKDPDVHYYEFGASLLTLAQDFKRNETRYQKIVRSHLEDLKNYSALLAKIKNNEPQTSPRSFRVDDSETSDLYKKRMAIENLFQGVFKYVDPSRWEEPHNIHFNLAGRSNPKESENILDIFEHHRRHFCVQLESNTNIVFSLFGTHGIEYLGGYYDNDANGQLRYIGLADNLPGSVYQRWKNQDISQRGSFLFCVYNADGRIFQSRCNAAKQDLNEHYPDPQYVADHLNLNDLFQRDGLDHALSSYPELVDLVDFIYNQNNYRTRITHFLDFHCCVSGAKAYAPQGPAELWFDARAREFMPDALLNFTYLFNKYRDIIAIEDTSKHSASKFFGGFGNVSVSGTYEAYFNKAEYEKVLKGRQTKEKNKTLTVIKLHEPIHQMENLANLLVNIHSSNDRTELTHY
ncbi:MAG: hypothetical protein KDD48_08865 [Bdellovibrionales bacterium]|nr:hypothetical protein [Bdellovibrionales bacterium]